MATGNIWNTGIFLQLNHMSVLNRQV